MRIRNIKPEFWRSEDIASIRDKGVRLLFIGLWSYVDDNGVGVDRSVLIATTLFPLDIERDPTETFGWVSEGLGELQRLGLIERYSVQGKAYLYISSWSKHQYVHNPNKPRYPLPTSTDGQVSSPLPSDSGEPTEEISTGYRGIGEYGHRGIGESGHTEEGESGPKKPSSSRKRSSVPESYTPEFEQWWELYPRKEGKRKAFEKFVVALRKTTLDVLLSSVQSYVEHVTRNRTELKYIKHPATWLNGECWHDEYKSSPAMIKPKTGESILRDRIIQRHSGVKALEAKQG
ncbi:DNA binding protein [Gordonia phage WilliamBoone]|nr:DNA binding protein [Gordonia phage WilliamBoone]